MIAVSQAIADIYRDHAAELNAALIRRYGFERAEDAVQDAMTAALRTWPTQGVPDNPLAWLHTAARNRIIDQGRRAARFRDRTDAIRQEIQTVTQPVEPEHIADDQLRLIFTCCHPALKPEARVALTLRTLCGLTTPEIARAFLVPEATMAQRLVRAQRKIQAAKIPFVIPDADAIDDRLSGVLSAIYLVFNEGYSASNGDELVRRRLCDTALRLAHRVDRLLPERGEVEGLIALMRFHDARRGTRTDAAGVMIPLDAQDRSRWDRAAIAAGAEWIQNALRRGPAGPYAIQAAIASAHVFAPTPADTDWPSIVHLYDALLRVRPSPVIALNRAAAIAMRDGPAAGLALIDALAEDERLARYPYLPAARADLLRRLGDFDEAAEAYRVALALVGSESERGYLRRRLSEVASAMQNGAEVGKVG